MRKVLAIALTLLVMFLATPAFGAGQEGQVGTEGQQAAGQTTNRSQTVQQVTQQETQDFAGIKPVSSDEAMAKLQKIVGKIYSLASSVAPLLTLAILIVGGLILFVSKAAKVAIIWAVIGMLVVLWAPQIVGLIIGIIK